MSKDDAVTCEGTVVKMERGAFQIQVDNTQHLVLCKLAGKMRKNFIKVTIGDKVTIEMSPYDLSKGRITYRAR